VNDYDIIFEELFQGGMTMYKETGKEKILRFSIIAGIAAATLYLFVNQYSPPLEESAGPADAISSSQELMAAVLQERDEQHDSPILVMVKEHEKQPVLVTYKVDIENNYRFETLYAADLKGSPTEIKTDMDSDGVWLKMDNSWSYYDEELNMGDRDEKNIMKQQDDFEISIEETDAEQFRLSIDTGEEPLLEKTFENRPYSVVRLSENSDLWLVLFEKDTILLVP
jgi:hypothetical protein